MQLYATYGNEVTDTIIVSPTPTDWDLNTERYEIISIPAADSWSDNRDIHIYAKDPTVKIPPILLKTLPQNSLKLNPSSLTLSALQNGGPVSHNYTGYHSDIKVEVEDKYIAAVIPTQNIYPAGSGMNLQLIVKKNEGQYRVMTVVLKDVATNTERGNISITQEGAGQYMVQGPYICPNWPTVSGFVPVDFDKESMSVNTIVDHFESAGIPIETGKIYSIATVKPQTGILNHYWTFRRGDQALGSEDAICREFYVLFKRAATQ
jgi:hypothetical protein